MAKVSFEEAKERIKSQVDFASIVSRHTKLIRSGNGFKALCPLPGHKERSPSFSINTRDNLYYCYGCQRGGDVFTFLELVEGVSFSDAVEDLASQLGIEIEKSSQAPAGERDRLLRGFDLLGRVQQFYAKLLESDRITDATAARAYLIQRGVSLDEARTLGLGLAVSDWRALSKKLQQSMSAPSKKDSKNENDFALAEDLRLVNTSQKGESYDFFRGRLMIPIRDHKGRTVGFSGRLIFDREGEPKYKNSAESPWFKKKSLVYGLDMVHRLIRDCGFVVLVEGYFDQWALMRQGIPAVAVMGVALTPEHLRLLERFTKSMVMLMDQDRAGREATKKNLPLLVSEGWDAKVFTIADAKDPDEWLMQERLTQDELTQRFRAAPDGLAWWMGSEIQEQKSKNAGRVQILRALQPIWGLCQDEAHRQALCEEIGVLLGLSHEEFRRAMGQSLPRDQGAKRVFSVGGSGSAEPESRSVSRSEGGSSPVRPLALGRLDQAAVEVMSWWIRHWNILSPTGHDAWSGLEKDFEGTFFEPMVGALSQAWALEHGSLPFEAAELVLRAHSDALGDGGGWFFRALNEKSQQGEEGIQRDKVLKSFEELLHRLRRERVFSQIQVLQKQLENPATPAPELARILQKVQELRKGLEKGN